MTVIEWLNGTSFEGPERTESYQFAVGYTKGANTLNAGTRNYNIRSTLLGTTGKTFIMSLRNINLDLQSFSCTLKNCVKIPSLPS